MRQREARGRRELGPLRTQASKGTLRGFSYLAFVWLSGRTVLFFDWPPAKQTANSRGMFGIERHPSGQITISVLGGHWLASVYGCTGGPSCLADGSVRETVPVIWAWGLVIRQTVNTAPATAAGGTNTDHSWGRFFPDVCIAPPSPLGKRCSEFAPESVI